MNSEPMKCCKCGQVIDFRYCMKTNAQMRERQLCFGCDFWMKKVALASHGDPNAVRAEGWHYYIGDESKSSCASFRGFGGRKFVIRFNDGRVVTTTNLWCQGEIPPHFANRLYSNAVFLKD